MAGNRPDQPKASASDAAPEPRPAAPSAEPSNAAASGLKPWLPVLANVVLMPVLAYLTTTFFLLPKAPAQGSGSTAAAHSSDGHGSASSGEGSPGARGKYTVPLSNKILVNVAGTMGTRYLLANLTLVGSQPNTRELVERNDAELRDMAAGVLAAKTITDLEKPGARNLIRTELISVFNHVLGDKVVTELYLTEFAIQ